MNQYFAEMAINNLRLVNFRTGEYAFSVFSEFLANPLVTSLALYRGLLGSSALIN